MENTINRSFHFEINLDLEMIIHTGGAAVVSHIYQGRAPSVATCSAHGQGYLIPTTVTWGSKYHVTTGHCGHHIMVTTMVTKGDSSCVLLT